MTHRSNSLATASMVLSILAIMLSMAFYLCIPMAAVGILLALLSRGDGEMAAKARTAIVLSVVSIGVSVGMTAAAGYYIYKDPSLRQAFQQMLDFYSDPLSGGSTTSEDFFSGILSDPTEDTASPGNLSPEEFLIPGDSFSPNDFSAPNDLYSPGTPSAPEISGGNYI